MYDKALANLYIRFVDQLDSTDPGMAIVQQLGDKAICSPDHPGNWLDLCCGNGSLLALASDLNYQPTGVDISEYQLQLAKQQTPTAKLILADIASLQLYHSFDIITCFGGSLNYLTDPATLKSLLARCARWLKNDGKLIFDINTPTGYLENADHPITIKDDNASATMTITCDPKGELAQWHITGHISDGKNNNIKNHTFEETHQLRSYLPSQINAMLTQAHLQFQCTDADDMIPPDHTTTRLMYTCWK